MALELRSPRTPRTARTTRTGVAAGSRPAEPVLARFPLLAVVAVIAAKTALQLAVAGRYGWHRDELYYFAAGRHLGAGYVDYPPVTPLLSALGRVLFGPSLVGQRSLAIAAGGAVVVLAALITRELGGRSWAQAITALVVGLGPLLLGSNLLFQTVSFDQLIWAALLLVTARLLRTGDQRLWPLLGLLAGVGFETKYTVLALLAGLALGLLATRGGRAQLHGRGPVVAVLIMLVLAAPNVWWQVTHGWPSVEFFRSQNASTRADNSPIVFVRDVVLLANPLALPIVVAGAHLLARERRWRPLAVAAAVPVAGFLALGGKGYYAAPVMLVLLPAGMVRAEALVVNRRWARLVVPTALVAAVIPFLPVALPVLPEPTMVHRQTWKVRDDYAEELGWPELVDTVAGVYRALPAAERADTAILTTNYGEAGAIDLSGSSHGLPRAASAHLTFRYWRIPRPDASMLLVIGARPSWLGRHCVATSRVAVIRNRDGVHNDEWGAPVDLCRLGRPFARAWPAIVRDRP